jgi:hypothetical protein
MGRYWVSRYPRKHDIVSTAIMHGDNALFRVSAKEECGCVKWFSALQLRGMIL